MLFITDMKVISMLKMPISSSRVVDSLQYEQDISNTVKKPTENYRISQAMVENCDFL
jgi:hypothetical protein